jgi:signal transduction histidine kinase
VPLQAKDRVLGVMNVGTTTPRKFSAEDVQLLTSIANQVAVAIENRMLYKEIRRKEEMRGELLRQIITAQEDERKRIARELHDETSQSLTGLAVSLEAVMNSLPLDPRQLKRKLRRAQSIALGTLGGIHDAIYELRPSLLDDLGLAAAVGLHAEKSLMEAGIEVKLEPADEERRLPIDVETALFRIFQEASTNIIRHARADFVRVAIHLEAGSAILAVEDNGSGFDINEVANSEEKERGLGLLGMRERAEFLGGSLTIRSRPGEGTLIEAEIPVQE